MIRLQAAFLLTDPEQIPKDLVKKGLGLEGTILDGRDLTDPKVWPQLDKTLDTIAAAHGPVVGSLHFPMNNADYLNDPTASESLNRYISLAQKHHIGTVVLHTNCFRSLREFDLDGNRRMREKYLHYFENLNTRLAGGSVRLGVENMPIIGNQGIDYDSVFVLPPDFADFDFSRIGITWDICHWAYTWFTLKQLKNFSQAVAVDDIAPEDFLTLKDKIVHTHFSSFVGVAYPSAGSICREGVPPQQGTVEPEILRLLVAVVKSWPDIYNMTLEIQEDDYCHRKYIYEAVDWVNRI